MPDTIPRDTAVIPIPPEVMEDDTVPDTALASEDSILPAPTIPEYPHPAPTGWAWADWEWGREELARYHGLSLIDLIDRIPGIVVTRAGGFGRPTGVSTLGMGGGRVRLFIDGYEMDPLASATLDLQHYGIADLGSLRVSRSLNEVRIEISTFRLQDSRPYSRIEIGAGNYETKLLRALFSRTIGAQNIVTAAFGLASTRGIGISEPFTRNLGALGWSYSLSPELGFEAQYRFTGVERRSSADRVPQIFDENMTRQELVLRGRARPFADLTVEGIVGRSWRAPADSTSFVDDELASTQAVLRAVYQTRPVWVDGSARLRGGSDRGVATPGLELALRGGLRPFPWLQATGEVRHANAADIAGVDLSATVRAGSWWGISLFGTVASGERALGLIRDSTFTVPREIETEVDGVV
ncbi:MAG TPA: Plug domain-containing protein, partial [Longimicrobiaceae bacterium]|nr:Plug domain-containing protein [Longimicrobiaceae bacterium]